MVFRRQIVHLMTSFNIAWVRILHQSGSLIARAAKKNRQGVPCPPFNPSIGNHVRQPANCKGWVTILHTAIKELYRLSKLCLRNREVFFPCRSVPTYYVCPHLLCLSPPIMSVPTHYVYPHLLFCVSLSPTIIFFADKPFLNLECGTSSPACSLLFWVKWLEKL